MSRRPSMLSPSNYTNTSRATFLLTSLSAGCVWYLYLRLFDPKDIPSFTTYFPSYYRAAGLIAFGLWCWGFNVQVLHRWGVNVQSVLDSDQVNTHEFSYQSIYLLASIFTFVFTSNLALFAFLLPHKNGEPVSFTLPALLYISYLALLFAPVPLLSRARSTFIWGACRTFAAPFFAVSFADVLLADIFTSFAKVIGDIESTMCLLLSGKALGSKIVPTCGVIAPYLMSLPYLWRFLQCCRQYYDERLPRHLFNALKYCTAFPVIFLSARQLASPTSVRFEFWLAAVLINTFYSFYWDVVFDWDLGRKDAAYPFLRQVLLFEKPGYYYAALVVNLMLRCTWSIKLSAHISLDPDTNLLLLEALEVIRRTFWIFLRVEHQILRDGVLPARKHMVHAHT